MHTRPFSELRDDLYRRSPGSKARVAAKVEELLVTLGGEPVTSDQADDVHSREFESGGRTALPTEGGDESS